MKTIKKLGIFLAGATAIFAGVLVSADTGDVAFIATAQYVALETGTKRNAVKDVITATWPDVTSFADVQTFHAWSKPTGYLCSLTHDRAVSPLSDLELLTEVLEGGLTPSDTTSTKTRSPTPCGGGLAAMATALGLNAASVQSIQCFRSHPTTEAPGCDWFELKTEAPATWRAAWEQGLVHRTVGVVE